MSAYVSIRQHTSAYVSMSAYVSIRQHTSAYVSIHPHTSAYVSIRQHTSAYSRCTRQKSHCACDCSCLPLHTSACVSIRLPSSAYASGVVGVRARVIADSIAAACCSLDILVPKLDFLVPKLRCVSTCALASRANLTAKYAIVHQRCWVHGRERDADCSAFRLVSMCTFLLVKQASN